MIIAGLEVPHVHPHVLPIQTLGDLDFANQDQNAARRPDARAATIRESLRALGYKQVSD